MEKEGIPIYKEDFVMPELPPKQRKSKQFSFRIITYSRGKIKKRKKL